jgi:hypothetical protein
MATDRSDRTPERERPNIEPNREPDWIKEGYDPDKGVLPPLKTPSNIGEDKKQ